jgi:hypothetical protein
VHEKIHGFELEMGLKTAQNSKDLHKLSSKCDDIKQRLLSLERQHKAKNLIVVAMPKLLTLAHNTDDEGQEQGEAAAAQPALLHLANVGPVSRSLNVLCWPLLG